MRNRGKGKEGLTRKYKKEIGNMEKLIAGERVRPEYSNAQVCGQFEVARETMDSE